MLISPRKMVSKSRLPFSRQSLQYGIRPRVSKGLDERTDGFVGEESTSAYVDHVDFLVASQLPERGSGDRKEALSFLNVAKQRTAVSCLHRFRIEHSLTYLFGFLVMRLGKPPNLVLSRSGGTIHTSVHFY